MVEFESAEFNKVFASLNVGELCGLDKELYKADSKNMFAFMTKRVNEADFPKEGEVRAVRGESWMRGELVVRIERSDGLIGLTRTLTVGLLR